MDEFFKVISVIIEPFSFKKTGLTNTKSVKFKADTRKQLNLFLWLNKVVNINVKMRNQYVSHIEQKRKYRIQREQLYYIVAYKIKQYLAKQLIEKIISCSENWMSVEQAQDFIILQMNYISSTDIKQIKQTISLLCCLCSTLMITPVRGIYYNYIQCFTLENYLLILELSNPRKWRCPIFKAKLFKLQIDALEYTILQTIRQYNLYEKYTQKFHSIITAIFWMISFLNIQIFIFYQNMPKQTKIRFYNQKHQAMKERKMKMKKMNLNIKIIDLYILIQLLQQIIKQYYFHVNPNLNFICFFFEFRLLIQKYNRLFGIQYVKSKIPICIRKSNQIKNSTSQGIIQFQHQTQEKRLESRKGVQKRKSKVIKIQLLDEYSEQFFGPSFSISGSQSESGDFFDNIESKSYYSYDYPTFEDEESSLDIEFISKNPILNQPPDFIITPISSIKLIVSLFCILLQWIQL